MLGSGAIIVVDDTHTALEVAKKLAKFYAHESCGKCVPCREGTNWTVKMLHRIESGEATPMDLDLLAGVQTQIIGNCLCVLGDAMAMPIGSISRSSAPSSRPRSRRRGSATPRADRRRRSGPGTLTDHRCHGPERRSSS